MSYEVDALLAAFTLGTCFGALVSLLASWL